MNVLGFSAFGHTSAAGLVVDGRLVAAAEEERFLRRKYSMALPLNAARCCLARAGLTADDLTHVGYFFDLKRGLPFYALHALRYFPASLRLLTEREPGPEGFELVINPLRTLQLKTGLLSALGALHPERVRFGFLEHHRCHAAHFFASPFDEAAVLTVDALGEWTSTGLYHGRGSDLTELGRIPFPHSLGALYAAVTTHLGYGTLEGPGKVMGLSAYGDPRRFGEQFGRLVRLEPDGGFSVDLEYFQYHRRRGQRVSARFIEAFGPPRDPETPLRRQHEDLAAALQATVERTMLHLARGLHRRTGSSNLVLAGGVALNSVANGVLAREGPFERIWVPPSPGDSGTALGAAYLLHVAGRRERNGLVPEQPFLGPEFDDRACGAALDAAGLTSRRPRSLHREVARLLAAGSIVGWFRGRMEFGPRALGHRSILADPRRAEDKDRLNREVKHREAYRPFAPACAAEACGRYFEDAAESPFMSFVVRVRPEAREGLAAVTHVDGTARLQTVERELEPDLHRLLLAFEQEAGVPVLLNTSFNVSGEPIVCTPEDAVRCFLSTGIDALVLGDRLVKNGPIPGGGHAR